LKRLFVALGCLLLAACSGKPKPPSPCALGAAVASPLCVQDSAEDAVSSRLAVAVFVDATDSMRGYVLPGAGTSPYQELLRALQDATTDFNQYTASAYKFGNQAPTPVEQRLHVVAGSTNFYQGVGGYTQIETLLNDRYAPVNPEQLTVIVTDLFQKDTDVTGLLQKLKTRYFARGLAVGIIGVESPFAGTVYDLDSRETTRSVRGPRPVYALVLGSEANIAHYFDALKTRSATLERDGRFALFTSRPFKTRPDFFALTPLVETSRGGGLSSIGPLADESAFLFRLKNDPARAMFKVCAEAVYQPYVVPFDDGGAWRSRAYPVEGGAAGRPLNRPQLVAVRPDREACPPETASGMGFAVALDTAALKQSGDYLFVLAYAPSLRADPKWWNTWNTDDGVAQPLRTLRLKQFLRGLEATALAVEPGQPVAMQFYVQK
jgi:hypothetical protein